MQGVHYRTRCIYTVYDRYLPIVPPRALLRRRSPKWPPRKREKEHTDAGTRRGSVLPPRTAAPRRVSQSMGYICRSRLNYTRNCPLGRGQSWS